MANQQDLKAEFERQAATVKAEFPGGDALTAHSIALVLVGLYANDTHAGRWQLGENRVLRLTWHPNGQQLTLYENEYVVHQGILLWSMTAAGVIAAVTECIEMV